MRGPRLALSALVLGVILVPVRAEAAPVPVPAEAATTVRATVGGLIVRSGPSTSYPVVRVLSDGAPLSVSCQSIGPSIEGLVRTTTAWDRLADGGYITDAYVVRPEASPTCPATGPTASASWGLRPNASTQLAPLGTVGPGEALNVSCQLRGEPVVGTSVPSTLWDWVPNAGGSLIADAFVAWPNGRPALPWCSAGSGSTPTSRTAFIQWAAGLGRQVRVATGVPVSVTIAQAILESGWGTSALSVDGNSFFGMKCFDNPGAVAVGCRPYATTECDASCYPTTDSFRVYSTAAASFADHADQLATLPRYRPAFAYVNDPNRFAVELHRAGYATDPRYARSLIALMRQFDLYQYDVP
jgi:Mannosyl-glycoprotein endo-beta-N-acetylglucosaminidase